MPRDQEEDARRGTPRHAVEHEQSSGGIRPPGSIERGRQTARRMPRDQEEDARRGEGGRGMINPRIELLFLLSPPTYLCIVMYVCHVVNIIYATSIKSLKSLPLTRDGPTHHPQIPRVYFIAGGPNV